MIPPSDNNTSEDEEPTEAQKEEARIALDKAKSLEPGTYKWNGSDWVKQ